MSFGVEIRDLTVRYGRTSALEDLSLSIEPGAITGLIGRNGSGKTTLLSTVAAFRRRDTGTLLVDGEDPWENERVTSGICLVRESGDLLSELSLRDNIAYAEQARRHFSRDLAGRLMDTFELDARTKLSKLSRGKRSAFGIVLGLASRAELTLLDEVHLGLDAPSRYAFHDALLADYVEHPRTIVLSSHLIEEMQRLIENVVIVHRGKLLLAEDAETLRSRGTTVTGPDDVVQTFTSDQTVIGHQRLGATGQVTVFGEMDGARRRAARDLGLELGPVELQDLFVHLTRATDQGPRIAEEVAR